MTNKLVVIINSLKVTKIKKILLYEMKFLVPNYSCLQNPWLAGYRPQILILSVLCHQLILLKPPPLGQNSRVRHCCFKWHYFLIRNQILHWQIAMLRPHTACVGAACVLQNPHFWKRSNETLTLLREGIRKFQTPGRPGDQILYCVVWYLYVLSTELGSCHNPAPRILIWLLDFWGPR